MLWGLAGAIRGFLKRYRTADLLPGTVIVALTAFGFVYRIWPLSNAGTDFDELDVCGYVAAGNLAQYWSLFLYVNPDNVPLFPAMLYLWGHLVGDDLWTLRLLAAGLASAVIPLVYLLGRECYGRGAGLCATLLYALSGRMAWHAGEPRFYVLFLPLAIFSTYALVLASRKDKRRWWILNAAANVALMHTFLFGVFLLVSQGLYLLLTETRVRVVIRWSVISVLSVLSALSWIIPAWDYIPTAAEDEYRLPTMNDLAMDWVSDEAARNVQDFPIRLPYDRSEYLIPGLHDLFREAFGGLEAILIAAFVLSLSWGTCNGVRALLRRIRMGASALSFPGKADLLVWLLVVLPPALIFCTSYLWRPCLMSRYTLYSTCAHFILIGALLSRVRPAKLGFCFVVVLGFAQLAQFEYISSAWIREPWPLISREIDVQSTDNDLILTRHAFSFTAFTHLCSERRLDQKPPILAVPSLQVALYKATHFLAAAKTEPPPAVFFVTRQNYRPECFSWFAESIQTRGMSLQRIRSFEGFPYKIDLFRICGAAVVKPVEPPPGTEPNLDLVPEEWVERPEIFALAAQKPSRWMDHDCGLEQVVRALLKVGEAENALLLAQGLSDNIAGTLDQLKDVPREDWPEHVDLAPDDFWGYIANIGLLRAQAAATLGKWKEAALAIKDTLEADYHADDVFETFFRALYLEHDEQHAAKELVSLDPHRLFTPYALWVELGLRPPIPGIPRCHTWHTGVPPILD